MPGMSQASRVGSRPTKSRGIFLWNLVVDSSTEDRERLGTRPRDRQRQNSLFEPPTKIIIDYNNEWTMRIHSLKITRVQFMHRGIDQQRKTTIFHETKGDNGSPLQALEHVEL